VIPGDGVKVDVQAGGSVGNNEVVEVAVGLGRTPTAGSVGGG
jgi:hypothetical protein